MAASRRGRWQRELVAGVLLAVLWHGLWKLAAVVGVHAHASLWYPAAGLTLAVALVLHPRHWLVFVVMVLGGAILAMDGQSVRLAPGESLLVASLFALAHGAPYAAGATTVRRWLASRRHDQARHAFVVLAVLPFAAGAAALAGVTLVGIIESPGEVVAWPVFASWFAGDLVGAASTTPFFTALLARPLALLLGGGVNRRSFTTWTAAPSARLIILVVLGGLCVVLANWFRMAVTAPGALTLAAYLPILAMLLIARLEPRAHAAAALALTSAVLVAFVPALGLDPTQGEVTLLLLALAVTAQVGMALRDEAERAELDSLTQLLNRGAWFRIAQADLRRRRSHALILVDVDHFKRINDRYGHATGDTVLRLVARALAAAVPHDARLGRIGGEEFAVLVPGDACSAAILAERLRTAVAQVVHPRMGAERRVAASFGVASSANAVRLDDLLERADAALYTAKRGGRDRVVALATTR